ncbi:hypothetical protein [Pontibacter anaerobius]|uniref:FHA domain-containing protein n=1 Tax=Pontibacter anaerobius TaxID=2993940 RepID=A0ABT3REL8_9BACT|nr:hypothetical protein [Pontibacter anaerobius]MCX2739807.1 hypothetical protein [Pontibacter anaerobius]
MNTIAVIISIIALIGAGFAFLRAVSAYNMLTKRIDKLKENNTYLEARVRKLEGGASRGSRAAGDAGESGGRRNQPRQEQQEQRQKQREKQPSQQNPERTEQQPQQPKRKKENRRRNERSMDRNENEQQGRAATSPAVNLEFAGGNLLDELEQAANPTPPPVQPEAMPELAADSGSRFAIIPEDGVIRQHQLQQRPDSDSYIEMDVPAEGSNTTRYRFNLSGNHAFVIAQGIDRLENAFDFEKPSNRMVSRVVLQGDGVLTKVNNGWKIQEKARIDFR